MNSLASQIAARASNVDAVPSLDPVPLTPAAVLETSRRTQVENEDPWEVAQQVTQVASNPDKMQQILNGIADDFDEHAPQAAMDAKLSAARMISFLAAKAPKTTFVAPGMPEVKPPQSQLNRFERYMKAIKDPTGILDEALEGTLTPESLEAVRQVYPGLYSQMQSDLADRINNAENVPYHRKLQLSALLGQDMAGTMNPRTAMMAQSAYASAASSGAPSSKPIPVSRIKDMNVAGRSGQETAAWRAAQKGVGAWNRSNR